MAIHPDSRFPLLPRDQADVIRIYLELKREQDRTGRDPEITLHKPLASHRGTAHSDFPEDRPEAG